LTVKTKVHQPAKTSADVEMTPIAFKVPRYAVMAPELLNVETP
jgi:hypothetical protein